MVSIYPIRVKQSFSLAADLQFLTSMYLYFSFFLLFRWFVKFTPVDQSNSKKNKMTLMIKMYCSRLQ
jgi:hypothetical protein